jgi:hypothetical protein
MVGWVRSKRSPVACGGQDSHEIPQSAQRGAIRNVSLPRDKTDMQGRKDPECLFVSLVGFSSCSLI